MAGGKGKKVVTSKSTEKAMKGRKGKSKAEVSTGGEKSTRNRASPSPLVKLYKHMSDQQKELVRCASFGGLLEIKTSKLPSELVNHLLNLYDPDAGGFVFPGRRVIKLTPDSVHSIFELPKAGVKVEYEFKGDAINFIHEKYGIEDGKASLKQSLVDMLKKSTNADEDYLRTWIMVAVCTFLCPTTALTVSPKCYPAVVNVHNIKNLNWCQFVVDELKKSIMAMSKRQSVRGCMLLIVVLYLDSLVVSNVAIPPCMPRISAWTYPLILKVTRLDTVRGGGFEKLKLKVSDDVVVKESILGSIDDIEQLVSSKAKPSISNEVLFPVLQVWTPAGSNVQIGHFFTIALNLREKRFELLDSSRSSDDTGLNQCCNIIVLAIKELWNQHYPNSRKKIGRYNIVHIDVPLQENIHDCGFHMLMQCEHWNGSCMPLYKRDDLPTIRKMLTYEWISHEKNVVTWRKVLNKK